MKQTEKKVLKNKRLVAYLMDMPKKIEIVTVDKKHVVAQVTKAFMPSDLPGLVEAVGHNPRLSTQEGVNYIIFNRW